MENRIKELRKALGLSQREFGERLGVSRDVVSNLEYGRVELKALTAKHICRVYSIREEWLMCGQGAIFLEEPNARLDEAIALFRELRPHFQDYALQQIRSLLMLQDK